VTTRQNKNRARNVQALTMADTSQSEIKDVSALISRQNCSLLYPSAQAVAKSTFPARCIPIG